MEIKEKMLENMDELHKFIILLVNVNGEPIKGRLKLQKMVYLLSVRVEEINERSRYKAGVFGPYSEVVNKEVQYLEQIGVLTSSTREIVLTKTGKEIAH